MPTDPRGLRGDAPLLDAWLRFLEAPYWMEAPLWQQVCPTLVCGPSGGGLHAVDEWVDLEQVRRFTSALVDVLSKGASDGE